MIASIISGNSDGSGIVELTLQGSNIGTAELSVGRDLPWGIIDNTIHDAILAEVKRPLYSTPGTVSNVPIVKGGYVSFMGKVQEWDSSGVLSDVEVSATADAGAEIVLPTFVTNNSGELIMSAKAEYWPR